MVYTPFVSINPSYLFYHFLPGYYFYVRNILYQQHRKCFLVLFLVEVPKIHFHFHVMYFTIGAGAYSIIKSKHLEIFKKLTSSHAS